MSEKTDNAGAVASNAGDDFHLIWACKKLLEMLKQHSDLAAVSVEGPSWEDSVVIEDTAKMYSIDLAEYYGGKNFADAHRTVLSQLKYSTYQIEKKWTAANLCASSNQKKDNSIIHRLADTYSGFCEKYESVQGKLVLKLVSNRSLSSNLSEHLEKTKEIIMEEKYERTEDLLERLDGECKKDIQRIYRESGLKSAEFIGFIQILDFNDCGTEIRSIHKAEIMQKLGKWGINNIQSTYNSLIMHLRDMMLPNQIHGYPMDKQYLLAALNTTEYEVFPAPTNVAEPLRVYIEREGNGKMVQGILDNQKSVVCLQATAGVGKTTFVSHLKDYLPKESVTILYDCYGGGTFLQPVARRHLAEVAIPQICNSLAVECGTEWLLGRSNQEYQLWRFLYERLENAVRYVKKCNPSAIVALIIDAADNSMIAAGIYKEECFLNALLKQPLPNGVFLFVTTRIERSEMLPWGNEVEMVTLPSFELPESTCHLRTVYPNATDEECEEFHCLTRQNPRVQTYLLSSYKTLNEIFLKIRPGGKDMNQIFKDFVGAAEMQYKNMVDMKTFFSTLIFLPRPIPEKILCEICEISEDILKSISIECNLGFYISESYISFRDEDFEAYIRNNYESNDEIVNEIANYMYHNRAAQPYCFRYVHIFLDKAGRFEDLAQISLELNEDISGIGVAQINHIMQQRIQYTLKRCELYRSENRQLACKLIYRVIDYNAKDEALQELLYDSPDEVILYCDEMSIYNVFYTNKNSFAALAKAALVFASKDSLKEDAKRYVKEYIAAINVYYNKTKDERGYHDHPDIENIVNIAEALLRLGEPEKAIRWITGWSPRKASTKYVFSLLEKLLKYENRNLCDSLLHYNWAAPDMLAIVTAYITVGKYPPQLYKERLLHLFDRMDRIPLNRFSIKQLIRFIESLIQEKDGIHLAASLINKMQVEVIISGYPSLLREESKIELDYKIRYYVIKQLCNGESIDVKDFCPGTNPTKKESEKKADEEKKTMHLLEFLLPFYMLRLACIQGEGRDRVLAECKKSLNKLERSSWGIYSRDYDEQKMIETGIQVFVESVCLSRYLNAMDMKEMVLGALKICTTSPLYKIGLLERMVYNPEAFQVSLEILEEVSAINEKYPAAAREMSEIYINCARVGRKIDTELGRKYFQKAIESTKGIDYEAYRKIYLYKSLAVELARNGKYSETQACRIVRLSEDFCRRMNDTKHFPYTEALTAAALLNEQGIWGALCRMDDRNNYDGFSIHETLPIVLTAFIENNRISIEQAISLTSFLLPDLSYSYNNIVDIILQKMKDMPPSQQKPLLEILIHDVLYNIPMDEKMDRSHHLISYLDSVVVSPELETYKIREMESFLQGLETSREKEVEKRNVQDTGRNIAECITEELIESKESLKRQLETLKGIEKKVFVEEWLEKLPSNEYVSALTWLMELLSENPYKYDAESSLCAIADFVDRNSMWPKVKEWRSNKDNQKYFWGLFAKNMLDFYSGSQSYLLLNRIFPADEIVQYEVFLKYISEHIQSFDEQLVAAICRMSPALSIDDVGELLSWCLESEILRIHPDSGDKIGYKPQSINDGRTEHYIAKFLWRMLGHPDKGLRCKAAHVLLRLEHFGNITILECMNGLYNGSTLTDYLDEGNYFFIESARVWYLSVCLKIVHLHSQVLVPYYDFFKTIALAEGVVHALQRKIAKEICLQLAPICAVSDLSRLLQCEQCMVGKVKVLPRYQREDSERKTEWKFQFDTMDTLRYWYDDVAEVFSCTQEDVASECDCYVAEFGITNKSVVEWRKNYFSNEYYGESSNGHGNIPTIETLQTYAEWHSMFYVADKFRQKKCIPEENEGLYDKWLKSYLPGKDGFWCSEFRNYVPLIPFFWEFKKIVKIEPKPEYIIPEELVEQMIQHNLGISLNLDYNAHFEGSNQYIDVVSATVNEGNLDKLLLELEEDERNFYDFLYEKEDYFYKDRSEFCIYPTCEAIVSFPDNALDKKDLLLKDYLTMANYIMGVSKEFVPELCEDQFLHSRVNDKTIRAVQTYHWSEPEEESGYEKHSTYGHLVVMEKRYLMDLLKNKNQILIFKISIRFEDDSYGYHRTPSKSAKKECFYILDKDFKGRIINI